MDAATIALLVAVVGSPTLGIIVAKYFRPNATPLEMLAEVRLERDADRDRIDRLERRDRISTDYMHKLRQHIAEGNPPPPPAWPEGLNQ